MAVTIGKAIKIIREANRKSLGMLAREAGISIPYLSLVERDKRNPSIEVINRIAEVLGIPGEVFLIIASGSKTKLKSESDIITKLIEIIRKMEDFEVRIKYEIEQQGCEKAS